MAWAEFELEVTKQNTTERSTWWLDRLLLFDVTVQYSAGMSITFVDFSSSKHVYKATPDETSKEENWINIKL